MSTKTVVICRRLNEKVRVPLKLQREHHKRKNPGRKGCKKTFDQNWAEALAAGDKSSCFNQEKLLALDEEHILLYLSITSLSFLPLEAVTVTSQLNRCLVGFLYILFF